MKLTDKQRQAIINMANAGYVHNDYIDKVDTLTKEEASGIIGDGIKRVQSRTKVDNSSPLKPTKVEQKQKIFDNYDEFIKACREYHDKLWEYQYTRDKNIEKFLDSIDVTESLDTLHLTSLELSDIGAKYRDYGVIFEYKPKPKPKPTYDIDPWMDEEDMF